MKAKVTRGEIPTALNYVADARAAAAGTSTKRPELISTNLSCTALNPRAMAVEFAAVRRLRPNVKRPAWHCSLALPQGERLSSERWTELVDRFLDKIGFDVALTQFVCVRHGDKPKSDHVHIVCNRIGLDGKVWHGKWEARKAIRATQELEVEFGLQLTPGLHGDDDAAAKVARPERQADSQSVINANRSTTQRRIDTKETARILLACAARSNDLPSFTSAAAREGITVFPRRHKNTGVLFGLTVGLPGRRHPLALSEATKNRMTWGKLLKTWEQNDTAVDAARKAAADAVASATARAVQLVTTRLSRQPHPEIPQARALTPEAAHQAKEAIAMTDDPLNFLSPPPLPRPLGQRLDDVHLAPAPVATTGSPTEPVAKEEDEHARRLREIEEEVDARLRAFTLTELFDARSAATAVPPQALTAEQLFALVNMIIRLLTFGMVKRTNPLQEARVAKEFLAQRAELELLRRRRSPQSVQERFAALAAHEVTAKARAAELEKRAHERAQARLHPEHTTAAKEQRRRELEAGFDRLQVHLQKPTLDALKLARDKAEATVVRRQARVDVDETELVGMFGLRVRKGTAAKAQAAARAASLAAAQRARDAAQRAWDDADEAIAESQAREQAVAAAAAAAVAKAELQEREALGLEIGVGQPGGLSAARRQLDNEARTERISGVVRDAAEVKGDTDAERAAARSESLRLMRKGG